MKTKKQKREGQPTAKDAAVDLGTPLQKTGDPPHNETLVALHRARFVDWSPSAATASAVSGDGTLLAVARESGDVELWQTDHWTCITTLSGSPDLALTSLAWLREPTTGAWRLFSGGLDGSLTEWDLLARRPLQRTDALGGAVWAIAAQPAEEQGATAKIAVACDDGCLRLFHAEEGEPGLFYAASMPHLEGRLLSVGWHPAGRVAVVGTSQGTLHAWDVASKREVLRIHTGDETTLHNDVWALTVLPDGTMVTGDSGGNVQLWEAAHGTLVAAFRRHGADVLAVAASPDGGSVFACGADPQVAVFRLVPAVDGKPTKWEYLESKRPHTHDARFLAVVPSPSSGPLLISGGNDAQLFAYRIPAFTKEYPIRLTKTPEAPNLHLATARGEMEPPLLLAVQREKCHLWQLGSARRLEEISEDWRPRAEGDAVEAAASPEQLATLSTSEGGHIIAAAISPNGKYVACGSAQGLEVHERQPPENGLPAKWKRKELQSLSKGTFSAFAFSGHRLLLATPQGRITVYDMVLGEKIGEVSATLTRRSRGRVTAASQCMNCVQRLVADDRGFLAAVQRGMEVQLLDIGELKMRGTIAIQEGTAPITAIAFGPGGKVVALGTASNDLKLYRTETCQMDDMSEQLRQTLQAKLPKMPGAISSISFLPDATRKAALVCTASSLCYIDFEAPAKPPPPRNKRARRTKSGARIPEAVDGVGSNVRVVALQYLCFGCHFTSNRSAVIVEKDWDAVMDTFVAPVHRHRYGS